MKGRASLLLVLAGAALTVSTSACRPILGRADAPVLVDTLFYISARARENGRDAARLSDHLEYGMVFTRRPVLDDPVTDGARIQILDSLVLSREAFLGALGGCAARPDEPHRFAVMYTHGYGTSLRDLWEHAALARVRARGTQPWLVFAWPSIGSGVAWPRVGEVLTAAYRQDSTAAAASHAAFAEALGTAHAATGGARLMLVAHSLGGQLVGETFREDSALRAALTQDPLRAVAFVSPDIALERFGDSIVPAVRPLAQRLLLYASADDRVLFFSEMVNDSERAGRMAGGRREVPAFPGVESVDMTDGQYANSWLVHTFGTRHALRRKSAALFDLVHIVGAQRPAECRLTLGTAERAANGSWRLQPTAVPAPSAAGRC
ncbi:alpha/beta hydrolase [Pseudogemmatithrix spongiicola]|uniref:Alpha/beta hydrolase n=1 Tax=Pseudogemmatithrix spongiicola TaxID=3062599 RepID=A0AA49Q6S4_9BACT|nr:alpha/beta hydrolase [Gemmatimonadaceae bacterium 'strain 138']WKW16287.1 alpha/beta hydrolase [Gemmatimonadaceae bacterium 'strain 318']